MTGTEDAGRRADGVLSLLPAALLAVLPLLQGGAPPWAQALGRMSVAVAAGAMFLRPGSPGAGVPRGAAATWALLLSWSLLSCLFTAFPHSADRGALNDLASAGFFFLAAGGSAAGRRLMRGGVAVGVAAVVATALPGAFRRLAGAGAVEGLLLNPNVLAAYIVLASPVAAAWFEERRRGGGAAFLVAAAAVLAATGSRAAWGAAVLQLFAFAALRRPWGRAAALAGAGLFGVLALGRLDADRLGWWLSSWRMAAGSSFLGVGPGAFGEAYPIFRAVSDGQNTLFAHNFLLEALAERGLLGASALNGLILLCLGRSARAYGSLPSAARAMAVGAGGFLLHSLSHVGFSFPALAWTFWWVAGGLLGETEPSPPPLPGAGRTVVAALAFLTIIFSFRIYWADELLFRAETALAEGRLPAARAAMERGLAWNRREPALYSAAASVAAAEGEWLQADGAIQGAVGLAPGSARFRAEAGDIAQRLGRRDEARARYAEAVLLLPLNKDYRARWKDLCGAKN